MSNLVSNLSLIGSACVQLAADRASLSPVLAAYVGRLLLERQSRYTVTSATQPWFLACPLTAMKLSESSPLPPHQVDECARFLTPVLLAADTPWLSTVTLQVEFESLYALGEHLALKQDADTERANEDALDSCRALAEACRASGGTKSAQVPELYRAIFALLLNHGCLSAESRNDRAVHREIAAALESVFPPSALDEFFALSDSEQRARLLELMTLVLGIRALNADIGRGGAGLVPVRTHAFDRLAALQTRIEAESAFINEVAESYTAVIKHQCEGDSGGDNPTKSRLIDELIHRRQHLLFLAAIAHEFAQASQALKVAGDACASLLNQLTTIVGLRNSVPRSTVFPLFRELGARLVECATIDEANARRAALVQLLERHRNPFVTALTQDQIKHAQQHHDKTSKQPEPEDVHTFSFVHTADDSEDSARVEESKESIESAGCVRLPPSHSQFMALALDYQGYCCHTLAHGDGLLVPGDPRLGVIQYCGRHLAFASVSAMREFVADPESALSNTLRVAVDRPALIQLLQLQSVLPHTDIAELITPTIVRRAINAAERLRDSKPNGQSSAADATLAALFPPLPVVSVNAASQTPIHLVDDSAIGGSDADGYHWNEWELRRRAVKLADLRSRITHATQTDLSHFRRANATQTTLPPIEADGVARGQATQTRIEAATNTEQRRARTLLGLRGSPCPREGQQREAMLVLPELVHSTTNPRASDTATLSYSTCFS